MLDGGLIAELDALVEDSLSAGRCRHSKSTAELARLLCGRFGTDGDLGYAAGLAHDAARELPAGETLRLCRGDGLPVSEAEAQDPVLLHGRAAAVLVQLRTRFRDPGVLQALRDHVTGRPSMGTLSRILFSADSLEKGRNFLEGGFRERTLALDLNAMTLAVLARKVQYVRSIGKAVSPSSIALLEELRRDA
jgi:predicted HD superfamily hydrolase involved in NAD metabolism